MSEYARCLHVHDDGKISALTEEGEILIKVLRIDNEENTHYRRLILEIVRLAEEVDRAAYLDLMGFPDNLPDLSAKRPPRGNIRPAGIRQSFCALKDRGELPDIY